MSKIAIIGSVGIPARYGGFETLVENLVQSKTAEGLPITVYCSSKAYHVKRKCYKGVRLKYINFHANGLASIIYDTLSIVDAIMCQHRRLLILGVSGAPVLPLVRLFCKTQIIVNLDGVEWKRQKWSFLAKLYLRIAEWFAVKFSHVVIADNRAIADYLSESFGCDAKVIPYGGDHAIEAVPDPEAAAHLPEGYALGLCRIEPENNIGMILEAFDRISMPLVFIGNWDKSAYGQSLKAKYANHPTITIHGPIYDPRGLRAVRDRAQLYLHGHSAGGTNPALVEMMHFGIPIAAYDCSFNRHTTENKALYFKTADELRTLVSLLALESSASGAREMVEIAQRRYTWDVIGKAYFALLEG
ncbi:MAG: glycosyl transferase [Altererythrobacter sp. XM-24bin4]|uniref:DUF1972 domain-containing protein n=1 Tax=uncultured Altererythrobacter sp. TaxID=500840 RepID=UPI000D7A6774|nr:DUF1972 domain-containing protein [uncultured Altererythrobacter sp.]PWL25285.1 MAG: glycosyl transferase [Altererythrobacter sp. XM-24bin4]